MSAIASSVPARLDQLPWSAWHWRVVIALGGFLGPPLYGAMIESGSRSALFGAYAFAAVLMFVAAIATLILGVDAERKPLEEVCSPLGCDPARPPAAARAP